MNVIQRNLLIQCILLVMLFFSATVALQLIKFESFSAQTLSYQWQSKVCFSISTKGSIQRFLAGKVV